MNRPILRPIYTTWRFAALGVLAVGALLNFSAAHAQVQLPTTVVDASRDATVDTNTPDANLGAEKTLVVATTPGVSEQRALVAFDDLTRVLPQDTAIKSAELRLGLASSIEPTLQIGLRCILTSWDEGEITWNSHVDLTGANCATPVTAPTTSPVVFDVTQIVDNWINAPADSPNEGVLLYPVGRTPGNRIFDSRESGAAPSLAVQYVLPPIQVCVGETGRCSVPAASAEVFNLTSGRSYRTDGAGYIIAADDIALGDRLWVRHFVDGDQTSNRYRTSEEEAVLSSRFVLYPGANLRTMRIAVDDTRPLYVRNLIVAAQWHLSEPAKGQLETTILSASNYLYHYTNGQFALGEVTVFQAYENWQLADIWLYASNTLRPLSNIKGDVAGPTPDPDPTVKFEYTPGQIYIGSYWNRFGLPPAAPLPEPVDVSEDYALAFSHELSHYILGQFDAYLVLTPAGEVETSFQCEGTAMGWVYAATNHGFIADPNYWKANCDATLANHNLQRTEWATIRQWFPWAQLPGPVAFAGQLPAGVTAVKFVEPPPAPPTVSDTYDLLYQAEESASRAARAFLFQNGRVLDQGKPVRGATAMTLPMAPFAGDRLCVIDIDPAPAAPHTPRNQYGCETLAAGDSAVQMERDPDWEPFMEIAHPTAATVTISVTQAPAGGQLQARLYPEHSNSPSTVVNLAASGDQWVGSFAVGQVTPAAYVEVWADETNTETNPRRTAIFDYGIGGGAAPGPQSNVGFAPTATSSDGRSFFMAPPDLAIGANQFIAIQTSGGAPQPPSGLHFASHTYRLVALPTTLVADGSVNIAFGDDTGGITRRGRTADAAGAAIYVWTGSAWQELPTRVTQLADGGMLASAPSQGQATYAVLAPNETRMFLPVISKR